MWSFFGLFSWTKNIRSFRYIYFLFSLFSSFLCYVASSGKEFRYEDHGWGGGKLYRVKVWEPRMNFIFILRVLFPSFHTFTRLSRRRGIICGWATHGKCVILISVCQKFSFSLPYSSRFLSIFKWCRYWIIRENTTTQHSSQDFLFFCVECGVRTNVILVQRELFTFIM